MVLDKQMSVVADTAAVVVDGNVFKQWLDKGQVVFFGDGSSKCKEVVGGTSGVFQDDVNPSAKTIGFLATKRFKAEKFEDLAYFEPYYLKDFRTTTPKVKIGLMN